jgi:hypothetical protein
LHRQLKSTKIVAGHASSPVGLLAFSRRITGSTLLYDEPIHEDPYPGLRFAPDGLALWAHHHLSSERHPSGRRRARRRIAAAVGISMGQLNLDYEQTLRVLTHRAESSGCSILEMAHAVIGWTRLVTLGD